MSSKTRIPDGAPTSRSFKLRQKFPSLRGLIENIPLGTKVALITISGILLAAYSVIIYPKTHADTFRRIQEENFKKKSLTREKISGGLNVWRDPFDREKKAASK